MCRVTNPVIESVTADIWTPARKIAGWRVSNTYTALSDLARAACVEVLNVAGATASASLTDILLAIAITAFSKILNRINGICFKSLE